MRGEPEASEADAGRRRHRLGDGGLVGRVVVGNMGTMDNDQEGDMSTEYGVDARWREIEVAMDAAIRALEDREADQEVAALIQARETMREMAREGRTYRVAESADSTVVHLLRGGQEADRVTLDHGGGPADREPEAHRVGGEWVAEG